MHTRGITVKNSVLKGRRGFSRIDISSRLWTTRVISGRNGSGKSTLIDVLLIAWPNEGNCFLAECQVGAALWRRQIGWLTQDSLN